MHFAGTRNPLADDDTDIPAELIGRLHQATVDGVRDLVAPFSARDRTHLAVFCYRKAHLHDIGLAIATSCDLRSLVKEMGSVRGQIIFEQSRERPKQPTQMGGRPRPRITLARSADRYFPPLVDLDDDCEDL
jgi:hypothetical protein